MVNRCRLENKDLHVAGQLAYISTVVIVLTWLMTTPQSTKPKSIQLDPQIKDEFCRAEFSQDPLVLIELAIWRANHQSAEYVRHDTNPVEQQEFETKVLWPLLKDIAANYPIERLRQMVGGHLDRQARGELKFIVEHQRISDELTIVTSLRKNDVTVVSLYLPQMIDIYLTSSTDETFQDRLVIALLHADHLLRHSHRNEFPSPDIYSSVWLTTIAHVLIPMLQADRLRDLHCGEDSYLALSAYLASKNDPFNDQWLEFTEYAAGQGRLAVTCPP